MILHTGFRRLALAGTFLFGSLFLYIAAAPDYVMTHLRLDETQFGWFFVPTIAGMSIGAFVSGRLAGKASGMRMVQWGFGICAASAVLNLIYAGTAIRLELPWAVLPMSGLAFGIALVFPILTIALLDLYPHIRGTASSMKTGFHQPDVECLDFRVAGTAGQQKPGADGRGLLSVRSGFVRRLAPVSAITACNHSLPGSAGGVRTH